MVDWRPRMIVRAAGVADVVAAVRMARELDLEISVRCGGHDIAGFAVPDGGLKIDPPPMGGGRIDPARRRTWVQGGALDRASQAYGLACDNVASYTMVTAGGRGDREPLARLTAVKTMYDPANVFHLNQNICPAH